MKDEIIVIYSFKAYVSTKQRNQFKQIVDLLDQNKITSYNIKSKFPEGKHEFTFHFTNEGVAKNYIKQIKEIINT